MKHELFTRFFQGKPLAFLEQSVRLALEEDGRDLTSLAVFGPERQFEAEITAKQEMILAGLPLAAFTMNMCTPPQEQADWTVELPAADGDRVQPGAVVARITGSTRTLLRAERVILNFLTHMSGIATLARRYVDAVAGTGVTVLDTRKTLPGLRYPEKYAVLCGGAANHRMNLEEMLMLKDNHVDLAGGVPPAVKLLRSAYSPCPPIEAECRTLEEVAQAVEARVDRIMLDNMDTATARQALAAIPESIQTEISGNVTLETIGELASLGPTFISIGRLTHSAPAADCSMRTRLHNT